jgi:hypothetical protein
MKDIDNDLNRKGVAADCGEMNQSTCLVVCNRQAME